MKIREFNTQADPLLSAFDRVANSNSHLLVAARNRESLEESFAQFVRSPSFKERILESDLVRDWHNYHRMGEDGRWTPLDGEFQCRKDLKYTASLSSGAFAVKLSELLKTGPCWYGYRYPEEEVDSIVMRFIEAFVPVDSQVLEVEPSFLACRDYAKEVPDEPESTLSFFENLGCDHCWTWARGDEILVLLLNGSD